MLQTILHEEDIMSGACTEDLEKQRSFSSLARVNHSFQENQQALSYCIIIIFLPWFFKQNTHV